MPNTYVALATQTLAVATNTVSFTSIDQNYTDLYLTVFCPGAPSGGDWQMRFNNDSATNYSRTFLFGTGSVAGSGRTSNSNVLSVGANRTNGWLKMNIQNYSNTTTNKTILWEVGSAGEDIAAIVGLYRSTSAITRLDFVTGPTFPIGSTFNLYGIAAA